MKQTLVVEETMTIKEAAFFLGVSYSKVRQLREELDPLTGKPYLESYQPSHFNVRIFTASVIAYKNATRDPEFWERRTPEALARLKRAATHLHGPGN